MLIALDIDGTIARSDGSISQKTVDAIIDIQQRGAKIVVASGRPTYGIAPVAELLKLKEYGGYVMSFNGGMLTECSTGNVLFCQTLPDDVIPVLVQVSRETGHALLTYKGNEVMTEYPDDEYVHVSSRRNRMGIRHVADFLSDVPLPLNKCIITGNPEILPVLERKMQILLDGKCDVYRSDPFFLEFVPLGIDKAKTLAFLLKHLNIERKDLVAFGDGYNDISMIHYAGKGVAMANASDPVREAADLIAKSNDEDGVALIVQSL